MIAFGCSITDPAIYREHAAAGIERSREADSVVFANAAAGGIARSYNLVLEQAAPLADLEALVLLHQDAEIVGDGFTDAVREALVDPRVAVVGCVGAVGARSIAWWEGAATWATFATAYGEWGPGATPAVADDGRGVAEVGLGEVDTLDGFVLVLAPWAVRTLRFDEGLSSPVFGFDFDVCAQARAAGRTVVAADLGVVHRRPVPELVTDEDVWTEAYLELAEKWQGRLPGGPGAEDGDARQRARRAEAEAGVAKLAAMSKMLQSYAQAGRHEATYARLTGTASWRVTEPLRRLNARRRALRGGWAVELALDARRRSDRRPQRPTAGTSLPTPN